MSVPIEYYLILSAFMFIVGVAGVLTRRNAIVVFMSVELMLNSANLSLITFSSFMGNPVGQLFVFFVMTVAAAEAAVGLAIIIALFRNKLTVNIDEIKYFEVVRFFITSFLQNAKTLISHSERIPKAVVTESKSKE